MLKQSPRRGPRKAGVGRERGLCGSCEDGSELNLSIARVAKGRGGGGRGEIHASPSPPGVRWGEEGARCISSEARDHTLAQLRERESAPSGKTHSRDSDTQICCSLPFSYA